MATAKKTTPDNLLEGLKKEIPFEWRIQSSGRESTKASCVAYINARDVMNLLDEVVGAGNWQDSYHFDKDHLIAGIGIKVGEWIWKYDTGTESNTEAEKGQFSDAFKRAGVKWGIGRFLYGQDIKWVDVKKDASGRVLYPIDPKGNRIYDLTEYLNNQSGTKSQADFGKLSEPESEASGGTPPAEANPFLEEEKKIEHKPFCGEHDVEMDKITKTGKPYHARGDKDSFEMCLGQGFFKPQAK